MRKSTAAVIGLVGTLIFVVPAAAHPLGNFTINHYSGLLVQPTSILVDYVIDMAEIPAYQEILEIDSNGNKLTDESERIAYRTRRCEELRQRLTLILNSRRLELVTEAGELEFPPGVGGLPTLRLTCAFRASLGVLEELNQVTYRDDNFAARIGWREIIVRGDGTTILDSTAPTTGLSARLTSYPADLLNSPLAQTEATFSFRLGGGLRGVEAQPIEQPVLGRSVDTFASLVTTNELSFPVILFSLLVALSLGALHALTPGHGKTIMAAYLVGTRGTPAQALFLGLTVTGAHTLGVLGLGVLTLYASKVVSPERLYPWLGLASGLIVIGIGLALSVGRLREAGQHSHAPHRHPQGHSHSHPALPSTQGSIVTWRSLVALGISGGLVPSASALVLLISAISLQRIGFGLVLILAFGAGMAAVLTGIGLLLVYAGRRLERMPRTDSLVRVLPMVSAWVVVGAGLVVTAQSLVQAGLLP